MWFLFFSAEAERGAKRKWVLCQFNTASTANRITKSVYWKTKRYLSGYFVVYVRLLQTGNFQTCKDLKDQFNVTYALCIEMMGHKHRALYQSDVWFKIHCAVAFVSSFNDMKSEIFSKQS